MSFDSSIFANEGLCHLIAGVGVSPIVVGTDFPYGSQHDAVNYIPGGARPDAPTIASQDWVETLRSCSACACKIVPGFIDHPRICVI